MAVPGSQNVFLNSLTSSILPTLSSLLQSIGNHMESCFCDARFLFWANECVLVTRLQMEASRLGHVTQEIRGNIKQALWCWSFNIIVVRCVSTETHIYESLIQLRRYFYRRHTTLWQTSSCDMRSWDNCPDTEIVEGQIRRQAVFDTGLDWVSTLPGWF